MGNPVQDLLDKLSKKTPETDSKKTTVSGKTSTGTKAKAAGQAKAGAQTASPDVSKRKAEFQQQLADQKKNSLLAAQKEAIAKKTNQDIINAAYKVADELKLPGGPWPLLRAAGWGHLTDNRGGLYKGPVIDEIDALTPEQKTALKRILGL